MVKLPRRFFRISLFNLQYLLQYKYGQQEKLSIIIPFVFGHSQGSELTVGVFFLLFLYFSRIAFSLILKEKSFIDCKGEKQI